MALERKAMRDGIWHVSLFISRAWQHGLAEVMLQSLGVWRISSIDKYESLFSV